jgi:hypothetical protein
MPGEMWCKPLQAAALSLRFSSNSYFLTTPACGQRSNLFHCLKYIIVDCVGRGEA